MKVFLKKYPLKKIISVAIALSLIAVFISSIVTVLIYKDGIDEQLQRLNDILNQEKSIILHLYTDHKLTDEKLVEYYKQISNDAFNIGETGEMTLAKIQNDRIYVTSKENGFKELDKLDWLISSPLSKAINEESGVMIGYDENNVKVYAAYTYLPKLKWAIVVKIPVSEISKPYYYSLIQILFITLFFIFLGTYIFIRITKPIFHKLVDSEEKLAISELKFRTIFEGAPLGIFRSTKEGKFIEVNQTLATMLGYNTPDEVIHSISDIAKEVYVNEESHFAVMNDVNKKSISKYENIYKRRNGDQFYGNLYLQEIIDENGIAILEGMVEDITDRKLYEEELRISKERAEESEKKLIEAQELSHVGSWEYYMNTDDVIWSKEMFNIFERSYDLSAPTYSNQKPFYTEESYARLDKAVKECVENEVPYEIELEIITASGTHKYIISKGQVKKSKEGLIIGCYGTAQDVTLQKKLERDLINAKEKAEKSNRLKTAFLNNMSHEVRTPLNAIVGFSQLMTVPNQKQEKLENYCELITNSSNKLINIITDVIEISEIQSNNIRLVVSEFEINAFIKDIQTNFENICSTKQTRCNIKIDFPGDPLNISADQYKIQRILSHIVDNAIKFTQAGEVSVICSLKDGNLVISVSDTGIGIMPEMQEVVFEPFRQIETGMTRNYGGNGLGLTIAKAYTELLNGSINLSSEINKGTNVRVTIPVTLVDDDEPISENSDMIMQKSSTLLIAEDEQSNYEYLLALLDRDNINCLYAENGQVAVDMCRNNSEIDLVLMDIKMPVLNGYNAAKQIKEFRNIPIIAQTAFSLQSEKEKFEDAFDDYITKPIVESDINSILHKYLALPKK